MISSNPNFKTIEKALILITDWRGFNFFKSKEGLLIIFSIKNETGYKQFQFIKSYFTSFDPKNIVFSKLDFDKRTTKLFNLNPEDNIHIKIKINDLNSTTTHELIKSIFELANNYYPISNEKF